MVNDNLPVDDPRGRWAWDSREESPAPSPTEVSTSRSRPEKPNRLYAASQGVRNASVSLARIVDAAWTVTFGRQTGAIFVRSPLACPLCPGDTRASNYANDSILLRGYIRTNVAKETPPVDFQLSYLKPLPNMFKLSTVAISLSAVSQVLAHGGVLSYSWGGQWYWGFKPYNTPVGQVTIQREWDT